MLEKLRELNPSIDLKPVTHPDFARYGECVEDSGISALIAYLKESTPVDDGTKYVASDAKAEELDAFKSLSRRFFGELPIQIGWCNGRNDKLNALEYHNGGEINVAASDAVLLLATLFERDGQTISTSKVRGFYIQEGQAVMLYATTLHFAPCAVNDDGFRVGIVLPRDTNLPLSARKPEDGTLFMKNKWLLAHEQAKHLIEQGAVSGLKGDFLSLKRR